MNDGRDRDGNLPRWSVAVFVHNEERSVARCIECILGECKEMPVAINIVVNGSTDGTLAIAQDYARRHAGIVSVHVIQHADKQNAWNQYVHDLRIDADVHFFVDGYAYVSPGSFRALAAALHSGANAAAAIPASGRSRAHIVEEMRQGGQLHGSLHALPRRFVERIRALKIRMPLGMYRGDGLLGAMALFDLDPRRNRYDRSRIVLVENASWTFSELKPWRWRDIRRQARRYMRQRCGRYEHLAIRHLVRSSGFEALPPHIDTLLAEYVRACGLQSSGVFDRMLDRRALRHVIAKAALAPTA